MTHRRRIEAAHAEPSPALSDRGTEPAPQCQGDASRCTMCTEGFLVCARLARASSVLAGADTTWRRDGNDA
jgi:hypothetical protein